MRRACLCLAVLVLAACVRHLPLTRTEAASAAQNWCVREGQAWGDPAEVAKPGAPDADGRSWWTVRFPGADRVVLVDADSGWTRRGR